MYCETVSISIFLMVLNYRSFDVHSHSIGYFVYFFICNIEVKLFFVMFIFIFIYSVSIFMSAVISIFQIYLVFGSLLFSNFLDLNYLFNGSIFN